MINAFRFLKRPGTGDSEIELSFPDTVNIEKERFLFP